jgi:hypothetical protein
MIVFAVVLALATAGATVAGVPVTLAAVISIASCIYYLSSTGRSHRDGRGAFRDVRGRKRDHRALEHGAPRSVGPRQSSWWAGRSSSSATGSRE